MNIIDESAAFACVNTITAEISSLDGEGKKRE
jgi:hypothetical protein